MFSQNTAQPKTFLITLAIHSTDTNLAPNNKTRHKQQQQEIRKDIKFISVEWPIQATVFHYTNKINLRGGDKLKEITSICYL